MNELFYIGERFESLKALHQKHAKHAVSYGSFYGRYKAGWELEKALTEPQSKNTRQKFEVDGRTYASLKALAIAAGISYNQSVKRCHRGWSSQEIFHGRSKQPAIVKQRKQRGHPVSVGGKEYGNLGAAYDALHPTATLNAVKTRLRIGWTLDEALEVVSKEDGRSGKTLLIEGVLLTVREAELKYAVPSSSIQDKIARGATPEQAVGLVPIRNGDIRKQSEVVRTKRERRSYLAYGVEYKSVAELAKAYQMDYHVVHSRLRQGKTPEQAVKDPVSKPVEVNERVYRSAMNAWRKIGETSFGVYNARKGAGHDIEICLGLKPLREQKSYGIDGTTYPSLDAVAAKYNIKASTLETRLKTMSIAEAVSYTPSNGRYTTKRFREEPELANTKGYLYFVELIGGEETLHKVGITQRTVASRLAAQSYRVISLFEGKLAVLFQLEQEIIKEFSAYRCRADEDFEGRTETFLLSDEKEQEMLRAIRSKFDVQPSCKEIS